MKHCPNCQRVLYDRRLTHCGYCGARVPDELRFTPERIAELDQEMATMEQERKRRLREAEEEMTPGTEGTFLDSPYLL